MDSTVVELLSNKMDEHKVDNLRQFAAIDVKLTGIETSVKDLKEWKWKVTAFSGGIGIIIGVIWELGKITYEAMILRH
jgi:hypothetical protein